MEAESDESFKEHRRRARGPQKDEVVRRAPESPEEFKQRLAGLYDRLYNWMKNKSNNKAAWTKSAEARPKLTPPLHHRVVSALEAFLQTHPNKPEVPVTEVGRKRADVGRWIREGKALYAELDDDDRKKMEAVAKEMTQARQQALSAVDQTVSKTQKAVYLPNEVDRVMKEWELDTGWVGYLILTGPNVDGVQDVYCKTTGTVPGVGSFEDWLCRLMKWSHNRLRHECYTWGQEIFDAPGMHISAIHPPGSSDDTRPSIEPQLEWGVSESSPELGAVSDGAGSSVRLQQQEEPADDQTHGLGARRQVIEPGAMVESARLQMTPSSGPMRALSAENVQDATLSTNETPAPSSPERSPAALPANLRRKSRGSPLTSHTPTHSSGVLTPSRPGIEDPDTGLFTPLSHNGSPTSASHAAPAPALSNATATSSSSIEPYKPVTPAWSTPKAHRVAANVSQSRKRNTSALDDLLSRYRESASSAPVLSNMPTASSPSIEPYKLVTPAPSTPKARHVAVNASQSRKWNASALDDPSELNPANPSQDRVVITQDVISGRGSRKRVRSARALGNSP
ncbi:hypothetical protein OBBRIDRAFT_806253 [Obba rivulosa]|uniref:Uncharacterized protein n=1 Tax=Obba rivulosa TaxID=1052685 RepID=A0A8E2ASI9_9APHY|nr:hypothetical protein OBBRIDRAFT_806253 [Obba rivulosa]